MFQNLTEGGQAMESKLNFTRKFYDKILFVISVLVVSSWFFMIASSFVWLWSSWKNAPKLFATAWLCIIITHAFYALVDKIKTDELKQLKNNQNHEL